MSKKKAANPTPVKTLVFDGTGYVPGMETLLAAEVEEVETEVEETVVEEPPTETAEAAPATDSKPTEE